MRIRKRFPPPSNNLSDPQLHNSTLLVQQQQPQQVHCPLPQQAKTDSQPSDPPNHHQPHSPPSNQEPLIKLATQENMVLINSKDGFEKIKSNETWKDGIQCAGARTEVILPSSSSHQVLFGGWFGEDRAIPIKKRRGSLGKRANKDSITKEEEEKTMAIMKSKMNKKCAQENGDAEQEAGKESSSKEGIDLNIACDVKKNVKRGSVIMEGSRCSRVNGRGWRCCQQTLVGYSLCEHHLGKGRLRSMNGVRNRAKSKKGSTEIDQVKPGRQQEKKQEIVLLDHDNEGDDDDYDEEDDDDDDDDELVMKKKKKIGMVKARSISSLLGLGRRESEVMVAETDKNRRVDEDK